MVNFALFPGTSARFFENKKIKLTTQAKIQTNDNLRKSRPTVQCIQQHRNSKDIRVVNRRFLHIYRS